MGFVNDIYVNCNCPDSSSPYKTGQTVSRGDYDDAYYGNGEGVDFFTLSYIPTKADGSAIFGHNRRFTGLSGGYHNGSTWVDKLGAATTEALAFPNDIVIDWSTYKRSTGLYAMFYRLPNSANINWNDSRTGANGLSIGGFSAWRLPNISYLDRLKRYADGVVPFNYPPFNISITFRFWSGTPISATSAMQVGNSPTNYDTSTKVMTESAGYRYLAMRIGTLTELSL